MSTWLYVLSFFFFKQKTAYEMRISDWSSDVCSSDLRVRQRRDGAWSLSGLLRPDEVEDVTDIDLPVSDDYDTIAGLVLRELGRIPVAGDQVEVPLPVGLDDNDEALPQVFAVLKVEHMDGLRVDRIRLWTRTEGEG